MTTVSVIIPAYNQAQFLGEAIESALSQTHRNLEVIVVDDGSTDATPEIARKYGAKVDYVRQENRGLAGARNTAIQRARGEYVGLLDSDDAWLPDYLTQMLGLATAHPQAVAYYCSARCMDATGRDLPETTGWHGVSPERLYFALLRSNFLIPSTMLLRRSAVLGARLFDELPSNGCEDWDLWLRLARQFPIVGTPACLVRYRIHDSSMSAGAAGMRESARAVIEKHFGPEHVDHQNGSRDKRRAYGGLHRYESLTRVVREHDWAGSAQHLRQAVAADPSLVDDLDLFYEFALGSQPAGYRGTPHLLDLDANARRVLGMVDEVYRPPARPEFAALHRRMLGTTHYAIGLAAYNNGRLSMSRRHLLAALRHRPGLWRSMRPVTLVAKSLLGGRMLARLKEVKQHERHARN